MMLPTDAAMTTRRSSLSGTLVARIGLPCLTCVNVTDHGAPVSLSRLTRMARSWRGLFDGLFLVLVLLLQRRDHGRVGQRRRVTERATFGHVAQEAAHDLAAAGLGQLRGVEDVVGPGERTDLL